MGSVATKPSRTLLGRAKSLADLLGPTMFAHRAFSTVVVEDLTRPIRDRVRERAEAKNVDVVFYCTCSRLWVQPNVFREALYELVNNAIRASRRGHPVVVDVRDTPANDVLWHVQDAGTGMSVATLAQLGSANGIARAWAIIESHEGLLSFESSLGVGTTATIWLPGKQTQEQLRPERTDE